MNNVEREIAGLIGGGEKLTSVFGYWPTFHDAEILDLHLSRGDVSPDAKRYIFPALTMKVHLWELTNEVDDKGFLVLRHHTLATMRFDDVSDLRIEGFNQQNAIFGLSIKRKEGTAFPSVFAINIEPAFGMGAEFTCSHVEVVDALACSDKAYLSIPSRASAAKAGPIPRPESARLKSCPSRDRHRV